MNIKTKTSYHQIIFVVRSKICKVTKHLKPEVWCSPLNYCGGESEWTDVDYCYLMRFNGFDYRDNLGLNAFIRHGDALNAVNHLKDDSINGKFDHKDGYGNLLYRVRKEFKIVEVCIDIKVRDV